MFHLLNVGLSWCPNLTTSLYPNPRRTSSSTSSPTKNVLLDIVTETVAAWHPRGLEAVEDCRQFVDRTYDGLMTLPEYKTNPQFLFSDSLGGWVVWNLFDRAPSTPEEKQLVRVLGGMLVHSFMSWGGPNSLIQRRNVCEITRSAP